VTLLGDFALLLALIAGGWTVVVGFAGARTGREETIRSAEGAMKAAALALTVAAGSLAVLLLQKDFSVEYVAQYTSRSLSVFYTVGAFWPARPGRSSCGPGCSRSSVRRWCSRTAHGTGT